MVASERFDVGPTRAKVFRIAPVGRSRLRLLKAALLASLRPRLPALVSGASIKPSGRARGGSRRRRKYARFVPRPD
jgi:hypothetical protein